ncbi:MAG: hypothetical protein JWN01_861 [Patescibacteria group bacterium]|nr:hypothetical protein [Patescibacteria group bacterium]
MPHEVTPHNSRYIPFTQQDSCCVPTSIQMIMYRNNIPLIPAEELGYHLGLTVSPKASHLFYDARTANEPPSAAGYGTQIFKPEFEPNKIFQKLGIPLKFSKRLAAGFADEEDLLSELRRIEHHDLDALLCFNHGVIRGEFKPHAGHVAAFDRIIGGQIRLVDVSPLQPKWRLVEPGLLLDAIKRHGDENAGGIWIFERQ